MLVPTSALPCRGVDRVLLRPQTQTTQGFEPMPDGNERIPFAILLEHFELFYRFQVNDNISITPGVFYVTNPEHNEDNDDIFVGLIRTVFRF